MSKVIGFASAAVLLVALAGVSGCGGAGDDTGDNAGGQSSTEPQHGPQPALHFGEGQDQTPTPAEAEFSLARAQSLGEPEKRPLVACAPPIRNPSSYPSWDCLVTDKDRGFVEDCGIWAPTAKGHLPDPIDCTPVSHPGQWYTHCTQRNAASKCRRLGKEWVQRCTERPSSQAACEVEVYGRGRPLA